MKTVKIPKNNFRKIFRFNLYENFGRTESTWGYIYFFHISTQFFQIETNVQSRKRYKFLEMLDENSKLFFIKFFDIDMEETAAFSSRDPRLYC